MKKIILLALLMAWGAGTVRGQASNTSPKIYRWYLELEPLQFINRGFSVVGHYALNSKMQIGTNVFSSTLSSGLRDLAFVTDGPDNPVARQQLGINLSLRYYPKANHRGLVFSLPVGYEWWELRSETSENNTPYEFAYLSPRVGYQFYIFGDRFYVLPEVVAILPLITNGTRRVDNTTFSVRNVIPFPGIGLGVRF